jgi:hypothetical protein
MYLFDERLTDNEVNLELLVLGFIGIDKLALSWHIAGMSKLILK